MKVKVIRTYIDAQTHQLMDAGVETDYPTARANSLIEKGFVEKVKGEEEPKEEPKKEAKKEPKKTTTKKSTKKK